MTTVDVITWVTVPLGVAPEVIDTVYEGGSGALEALVSDIPYWLRFAFLVLVVITYLAQKWGFTAFVKEWLMAKLRKKQ